MAVAVEAITIETGAHVVHLYEDDADLIATLGAHVAAAIGAGDAALIIATGDHRDALAAHLAAAGLDVEEARRAQTYVTLDGAATLARFCTDGELDADVLHSDTDVPRSARSGQPRSIEKPPTRAAPTAPWWLHPTLEVHLATGMVAAQLGIDTAQALGHLRSHAADNGEILEVVARAVVNRELRLHDPRLQGEP